MVRDVMVPCRPTSPSQHMRQLLTEVDSHIMHARMMTAPQSPPPPPAPTPPPACPVNITFHGAPAGEAAIRHGAHELSGAGPQPQQASREQYAAVAGVEPDHHPNTDDRGLGQQITPAHGRPQPRADESRPHRQNSTARRHRLGSRPRISASDIIPPQAVAEDALRQARIDYFADVQRIKQKRLQDWGQMFGQAP